MLLICPHYLGILNCNSFSHTFKFTTLLLPFKYFIKKFNQYNLQRHTYTETGRRLPGVTIPSTHPCSQLKANSDNTVVQGCSKSVIYERIIGKHLIFTI